MTDTLNAPALPGLTDDSTAAELWAEIHRLRAAVQGPEGFASWQEAATAERIRRVKAEHALAQGKTVAYLYQHSRVCADGSMEDGPWDVVLAQQVGTPVPRHYVELVERSTSASAPALPADEISAPGCVASVKRGQIALLRESALGQLDHGRGRHVQISANTLLDLLAIAEALPDALATLTSAPAGWKLVPEEPTAEMVKQMVLAWLSQKPGDPWDDCAQSAWCAGVKSAPAAPSSQKATS